MTEWITPDEYRRRAKAAKAGKYKARATMVDGVRFASAKEAKRDAELHLLQKQKKIFHLVRQPRLKLIVNEALVCTYVADWSYLLSLDGPHVIEDCKGFQTQAFKIKWVLAKALFPHFKWVLS